MGCVCVWVCVGGSAEHAVTCPFHLHTIQYMNFLSRKSLANNSLRWLTKEGRGREGEREREGEGEREGGRESEGERGREREGERELCRGKHPMAMISQLHISQPCIDNLVRFILCLSLCPFTLHTHTHTHTHIQEHDSLQLYHTCVLSLQIC